MKNINFKQIYLLPIIILAMTNIQAETNLKIGKKLSNAELSSLKGTQIKLGDQAYKVISEQHPVVKSTEGTHIKPKTFITNNYGVVGMSENIVLISETPIDQVRSVAKNIINTTVSTKHYNHLNVSSLQFNTFTQAITARNQLLKLLPQAKITIPIQFSENKLR